MAEDINNVIISFDEPGADADPFATQGNASTDDNPQQSLGASVVPNGGSSSGNVADGANNLENPNKSAKKQVSFQSQESSESTHSRSRDEPVDEVTLLIAATLVEDAKEGRNLPFIPNERCVKLYRLYHNHWLRWILYLCILVVLSLAVFEEPAVPGMALPYWATMMVEFLCMLYFASRMLHAMNFQTKLAFFKDAKNVTVIAVIFLTVLDMICYIIWRNMATSGHPIRLSRLLRPLFIINFPDGKQIRRAFRNIRRTVPDILNVLILFILSVLIFGLLILKLFQRRNLTYPDGRPYFDTYYDSVWDLYVLVTTANNPDVMMPAYDYNNWFAIVFVVYVILCLYIFMSIVLAAIYNNYRKNLKNEVKTSVFLKRQQLSKAFELLKVVRNNESIISHARWKQLTSVLMPAKSDVYCDLMMKILDDDNTNVLSKKNFMNLADLLHVQLTEVKDRLTLQEQLFPNVYNHPYSELFKSIVRHRFFRYVFDFMIVVNAVFIAIDLDVADWFFLAIFTFEILCNLYVAGFKEYFQRFWYAFDFFVIGSALIATIVEKSLGFSDEEIRTLDVLLVLRVMRLIKIFGSIKRFKVILQTLLNIGSSIVTYGGVIFVFFYSFSILGMELFSGLVHYYGYDDEAAHGSDTAFCGNPKLEGTQFYSDHYCANNFNHIFKALVVMFELMVVNQWHVITSGFVFVTSRAARLFFWTFHMCTVVIVLNIFTAFILEAFILEYTLQTVTKLESAVEAKIKELGLGIGMKPRALSIHGPSGDKITLIDVDSPDGDPEERNQGEENIEEETHDEEDSLPDLSKEKGFKFHLRKRSRKKVEVLLQNMFQGELGDEEEGPEDLSEVENYRKNRKLTLEEVA